MSTDKRAKRSIGITDYGKAITQNLRFEEEGDDMSEKKDTSAAVEKSKRSYKDQAGFLELVLTAIEGGKDVAWIKEKIEKMKNSHGQTYLISEDGVKARIKKVRSELKEESGGEYILERIDGESSGRISAAEKLAIVRKRLGK